MSQSITLCRAPVFLRAREGTEGTDSPTPGQFLVDFYLPHRADAIVARNAFECDPDESQSFFLATLNHVLLEAPVMVGLILNPESASSDSTELRAVLVALLPAGVGEEEKEPWMSNTPSWVEDGTAMTMFVLGEMYRGSRVHPESLDEEMRHWMGCIIEGRTLPIEDYHLHRALGDLPEGFP